jgi:hypothetical protein
VTVVEEGNKHSGYEDKFKEPIPHAAASRIRKRRCFISEGLELYYFLGFRFSL